MKAGDVPVRLSRGWIAVFGAILLAAIVITSMTIGGVLKADDFGRGLLTLTSTAVGALLAFLFQKYLADKKERERRITALHRALVVLSMQYNGISQIWLNIAQYEASSKRAFAMPAYNAPQARDMVQKFDDLVFLIETNEFDVLVAILLEQQRFDAAIDSLTARNKTYVEQFQSAFSRIPADARPQRPEQLNAALGDQLYFGLIAETSSVFLHVKETLYSLAEAEIHVGAAARRLYPRVGFLTFGRRDDPPKPQMPPPA